MWEFIRDHPLHPRIVRRLQGTSFYRIIEIGRLQFDWVLITAMIERWRPETHMFHLPIDEATITLEDVEVLFGLPDDGAHRTTLSGASRLQLMPVRQHLVAMYTEITDDSPPEDIDRHTRLLLLMFGGILQVRICRMRLAGQKSHLRLINRFCGHASALEDRFCGRASASF
nr:protein MAIN-LIKE 2-like [Nicotiana tomentosiformis]